MIQSNILPQVNDCVNKEAIKATERNSSPSQQVSPNKEIKVVLDISKAGNNGQRRVIMIDC